MQTRKIFLVFLVMVFYNTSLSQTISKQVMGSAGKTQNNSNLKISWTTGEPVVGLMTSGGYQLGNGYYPALNLQALNTTDNSYDLQFNVYPNPTSQKLYISHPEINSFDILIIDLNGKQIYSGKINKEQPIDVTSYSKGIYLITIESKEINKKNTYKIIKN